MTEKKKKPEKITGSINFACKSPHQQVIIPGENRLAEMYSSMGLALSYSGKSHTLYKDL
jgi:hypothetical protein